MDLTQIENIVPPKYRTALVIAIAISPYLTRAYHALSQGGGIKGVLSAIWLGTNIPAKKDQQPTTTETK